jgi:hypothetical protein
VHASEAAKARDLTANALEEVVGDCGRPLRVHWEDLEMKPIVIGAVLLGALALGGLWIAWPKTGSSATIVNMAKGGASETEMLQTAAESHPYRLSADDVVKLKTAGVPSAVIVAMLHNSAKR